ncbi:MAG: glycosyltransferase family 39 protein [Planctomycetota bacterium]|nr:glycosyltransferase family 39 protein [Planctomycetota bacterium]
MPGSTTPWVVVALLALTLLALGQRWAGLDSQLPQAREADPALVHYAAYYDRPAGMGMNDAVYPSTVYPVFLGRLLVHLPGSGYPIAAAADAPLADHLAAASAPYVRARWMIALLSLLAIPCTYLFARNWLEPWWAVFAAALSATCLLGLELGAVAKPHGALAGFSALCLWAVLRLLRSGRARDYALAGAATGCALAALNSGCFLFPSFVLAHVLGWRADRDRKRWRWFALAVAFCAVLFVSSYWFLFFPERDLARVDGAFNFGQQAIDWESWGYRGFLDMVPRTLEHDPALVVLAGLGLASIGWSFVRGRMARVRDAGLRSEGLRSANLVVGLFVLIFVVLFGIHARYYARFTLPMLPVLALLGALGVRAVTRWGEARWDAPWARRTLGPALAVVALAFPLHVSLHLTRLRARDDTARLAARWIETHLDADAGPVALDASLTLPVFVRRAALQKLPRWGLQPWSRYQLEVLPADERRRAFDLESLFERGIAADRRIDRGEVLARLAAVGAHYAVVAVPAASEAWRDATRATVRELGGEPVVTFLPFGPGGSLESILTREADPRYLAHLLGQERLGPPIEIYALP